MTPEQSHTGYRNVLRINRTSSEKDNAPDAFNKALCAGHIHREMNATLKKVVRLTTAYSGLRPKKSPLTRHPFLENSKPCHFTFSRLRHASKKL